MLDVSALPVVIVGGGSVAARKAAGVIAAGATQVRCVSPVFHPDIPDDVECVIGAYDPHYLDGARLVFAATDRPEVNDAVVRDCRQRGIWVCRADSDEAEPGDFVTPAKFEEGPVIVAVSAGSAALSAAIRDHVAQTLDRRYIRMAEAMKILRPAIRSSPRLGPARRAAVFRDLAGEEALATLEAGGIEGLRDWIARRFPELTHA